MGRLFAGYDGNETTDKWIKCTRCKMQICHRNYCFINNISIQKSTCMHDTFVAVSTHAKHLLPEQAACMVMMPPLLSKLTVIKKFKWTLIHGDSK